jgi:hypothetical protein
MCKIGRDITADAVLSAIGNSPHTVTIERMQANLLQIPSKGVGTGPHYTQHGFAILHLPDGRRAILDPTAGQFLRKGEDGSFTAEHLLATDEGAATAAVLMRDGMLLLPADRAAALKVARQYAMLLGADASRADEFGTNLLAGDATILTERIEQGKITRETKRPEEARDISHILEGDPSAAKSMAESAVEALGTPYVEILRRLSKRLEALDAAERLKSPKE